MQREVQLTFLLKKKIELFVLLLVVVYWTFLEHDMFKKKKKGSARERKTNELENQAICEIVKSFQSLAKDNCF